MREDIEERLEGERHLFGFNVQLIKTVALLIRLNLLKYKKILFIFYLWYNPLKPQETYGHTGCLLLWQGITVH